MSFHPSCDDELTKLLGVTIPVGLAFGGTAPGRRKPAQVVSDPDLFLNRLRMDLETGGEAVARSAVYRSKEVRRALAELSVTK